MTVMDSTDFTYLKRLVKNTPALQADFKTWDLTKQEYYDAFQAAENYMISQIPAFQAAVEVAVGPITQAQATVLFLAWANWKYRNAIGGI